MKTFSDHLQSSEVNVYGFYKFQHSKFQPYCIMKRDIYRKQNFKFLIIIP